MRNILGNKKINNIKNIFVQKDLKLVKKEQFLIANGFNTMNNYFE